VSDHILAVSELTIKPGELENFRALIGELVTATQANEPNTLCYEYYISPDGKQCHIYERYADSPAVMTHMQNFAAFAERFMAAIEMTGTAIYGNPSPEVRELASGLGHDVVFMVPLAGFAR
jgi:quinol monooxygenase YgiN